VDKSTAILPGPDKQPLSREDALAARLRSLRRQPSDTRSRDEGGSHGDGRAQPPNRATRDGGSGTATPPAVATPTLGGRSSEDKAISQPSSASPDVSRTPNQTRASYRFLDSEAADEDAVDELLEALGDEAFDLAAEEDAEPPPEFDPRDEAQKVAGLLESFQKSSRNHAAKEGNNPAEDDDDDSDGEQMTRAVETLLSQIGDEINALPPPGAAAPSTNELGNRRESGVDSDTKPAKEEIDDGNDSPFTLPTVPSQLVDPVPDTNPADDFEADISARMASLRGLGSLDALGLPSAPTFRPGEHGPSSTSGKGLLRSSKYTDEDQKTWCVVCLEDATIRCVGCDNDVYCARCWKEMHVGPSAGYDERGHQWVKFERTIHP